MIEYVTLSSITGSSVSCHRFAVTVICTCSVAAVRTTLATPTQLLSLPNAAYLVALIEEVPHLLALDLEVVRSDGSLPATDQSLSCWSLFPVAERTHTKAFVPRRSFP